MSAVTADTLLGQLRWRYATKKFDASRRIADADWKTLQEAVTLAPSSYGFQPWKFFVVTDPAIRKRLQEASWNQPQIVDASHLVVFSSRQNAGASDVDRYLNRIAQVRQVPRESLDGFKQMLMGSVNRPGGEVDAWCTRQVYIALGVFLSAAAMLGIDACPMEGFDAEKYDQILNLPAQGYNSRVLATAGYRSPADRAATTRKVRFPVEEVIGRI
ncbi:MAG: NAD(P)H-dependent oxidoreductase [Planctomycetaceae bacterium]|nr:MAG: NAD(P)H-dependent oxidoreductase [Planctomycetaceae bacterium]